MSDRTGSRFGTTMVVVAMLGIALTLPALTLHAQRVEQGEKTKRVPLVTVTQNDGTRIHGEMVGADPDKVVVMPEVKAGEAAEPVEIAWSDIKAVSNGLTRAKALQSWKEANGGKLCQTCAGDREMNCGTCKGTAHDAASAADCATCKGTMEIACKDGKCKEGQVPCPANYIKRYEGKWEEREGRMVRVWPGGGWASEPHVGELIDAPYGKFGPNRGPCPTCGKTTWVDHGACEAGKAPCPVCKARRDAADCSSACDKGNVQCTTCNGTGLKAA